MRRSELLTFSGPITSEQFGEDLPALLKQATRAVHEQLERELGLGAPGIGRERYGRILARFYGLYAVWEPSAHAAVSLAEVTAGRSKLPHLAHDLATLGVPLDQAPLWPGDPALTSAAAGLGAMYVMEGATLGGQVISRTLSGDADMASACSFFQPYGNNVGSMWRAFLDHLRTEVAAEERSEVVSAGVRTFQAFRDWLVEGRA